MSDPFQSSPDLPGTSPGAILRRCREFHEISLEEAAETTKIGITHLRALEDDRIHDFANQAYLKGFLRIYVTYLGLNCDDIARMYDKLYGVQGENREQTQARTRTTSSSVPRAPRILVFLKKLIFPAILLVLILITATFFKKGPAPLVRPEAPPAAPATPVAAGTVQGVQSSARTVTARPAAAPAPVPQAVVSKPAEVEKPAAAERPAEAHKGFILKIRAVQNGTLTSTVDGSSPQQHDLTSGDIIEWKAERKVTLELNNAGAVEIEVNGKPYKPPGVPGKPAYFELDADNINR